jgi:hypothetical protein
VTTISADVTDETAAHRILAEVRLDILALQGATTSGLISEDVRALWTHKIVDPRLFPSQ